MWYADVIVPLAVDSLYTYAVPDSLIGMIGSGSLVLVSFAGNKKYTALVVKMHELKPIGYEVKSVEEVAEEQIRLSVVHLKFLLWVANYYMATAGEVMKAALPIAFRLESYTEVARTEAEIDYSVLTDNERVFLEFLQPNVYVALKNVEKYLKIRNGMSVAKSLLSKKYVEIKESVDEMFREKMVAFVRWKRNFSSVEQGKILDDLKRAPAQYKMLCRWIEEGKQKMERADFLRKSGGSVAVLKGLCEKHILDVEKCVVSRIEQEERVAKFSELSEEQNDALNKINDFFKEKDCVLLKGVTSSGKTEIYIHLIREYLKQGKQVLYMLPEIALTVQIVKRLQNVFSGQIGVYHSGMSDQMRAELWRKQCSDKPLGIVLGVRSSVFLPFSNLGLIVVDEEHDTSYKQKESAPRYHGRDSAIMLAKMYSAKVLLGSATPSFESYQHAISGKYGFVELERRYGGVSLPQIVVEDIKECRRKKIMQGSFSPLLINEMNKVLADKKQVILFQNRRGYSTYVQCEQCGSIPKCKHCDVSMTYYKKRNVLVCRYCGSIIPMLQCCSECGSGHYKERTPGTEHIEEEVGRLFPGSRVARMDLDVMSSKSRFRHVVDDFEQGKTDVLIGTQMVTKGLDFKNVKLVGVMDADSIVNFPDFRAEERAFCMLMQVSGRSGRKDEQGKVVIQASNVNNRVYKILKEGSYSSFFQQLSVERRLFMYPPFGRLIQVELRYKDIVVLRNAANWLADSLRKKLNHRVCGPAVPEVGRIGGAYRLVILLKVEPMVSYGAVKSFLKENFLVLKKSKEMAAVKVFCDIDP